MRVADHYRERPAWWALAYASLAFELFAPLLFLWKRTRGAAILFGIGFHLSIALLMKDLVYFSTQMITFYIVFLAPSVLHRCMEPLSSTLRKAKLALRLGLLAGPAGSQAASGRS